MNAEIGKKKNNRKHDPVRAAAMEAVILVEQGEPLDDAVKKVTADKQFRRLDIRFLLQLVNGVTKMRRRLDHEIKFYLKKPSAELPVLLANILRLGFYQLIFTDRVPSAAAVSEAVNLAHHFTDKSQAGMVNAVLRARLRDPDRVKFILREKDPVRYFADFYSYPDHFVKYCLQEFGEENTEKLLIAYNQAPHVTYRVNYLVAKPDEVTHILQENEVEFSFGRYLPEFIHIESGGLPLENELVKTGKVFIQDESAGLPVRLLNPKPGDNVIDLTAAPGGKTTYLAIRMRNKGRITAIDKSHRRLELLVDNAKTQGIKIISPVISDMADFKAGPFDRVLLDPPCSGWGTAGKRADLRWNKTSQDISNLSKIQAKMIDRASKLVKPGGVLVYSTCTIIRNENDQVVEEFLVRNPNFEIESASQFYPEEIVSERGFVKTYPDCPRLDGAFCVRLKRRLNS